MSNIEKFVELAKSGDYEWKGSSDISWGNKDEIIWKNKAKSRIEILLVEQILLDPKAWAAVGKNLGWDKDLEGRQCTCSTDIYYSYKFCSRCGKELKKVEVMTTYWKKNMHRFLDLLIEEKTPEEALTEILTV